MAVIDVAAAVLAAEGEMVENEQLVPLPAWAYGLMALGLLLVSLLVVTRLDLDR